MNSPDYSTSNGCRRHATHGFSLVEVTLAIAVVAIGLVGIMALFPLGMDAVRQAADSTQMMALGQDNIADFQQEAANSNCYAMIGAGLFDPTQVINPLDPNFGSYSTNLNVDGIWYHVNAVVSSSPAFGGSFSGIWVGGTNMISRVQIGVYRIASQAASIAIGSTNYYFTEVDRYVQ